ncbi:hypothetical protein BACPU_33000 [Bacillus pumilus]|nr:hypothetical protein BACPU_33000 [Bacillus pumilus]
MGIILDIFYLAIYKTFLQVDEDDISRNVTHLKKYTWFRDLLNDQKCKEIIIYDSDVRHVIGQFKTGKLHKRRYNIRCERKLHQALFSAM